MLAPAASIKNVHVFVRAPDKLLTAHIGIYNKYHDEFLWTLNDCKYHLYFYLVLYLELEKETNNWPVKLS